MRLHSHTLPKGLLGRSAEARTDMRSKGTPPGRNLFLAGEPLGGSRKSPRGGLRKTFSHLHVFDPGPGENECPCAAIREIGGRSRAIERPSVDGRAVKEGVNYSYNGRCRRIREPVKIECPNPVKSNKAVFSASHQVEAVH